MAAKAEALYNQAGTTFKDLQSWASSIEPTFYTTYPNISDADVAGIFKSIGIPAPPRGGGHGAEELDTMYQAFKGWSEDS